MSKIKSVHIGYLAVGGHHGQVFFTPETGATFLWNSFSGFWNTISRQCRWDYAATLLGVDLTTAAIYEVVLREGGVLDLIRDEDKEVKDG